MWPYSECTKFLKQLVASINSHLYIYRDDLGIL